MRIGVRELRNRTTEVIAAVESGERVTLTVRGDPVADIVPHGQRSRWLSGEALRRELADRAADPDLTAISPRLPVRRSRAVSRHPVGLLDTSVFRARESERPLRELPERVACRS